jgi:hypothetical protein
MNQENVPYMATTYTAGCDDFGSSQSSDGDSTLGD